MLEWHSRIWKWSYYHRGKVNVDPWNFAFMLCLFQQTLRHCHISTSLVVTTESYNTIIGLITLGLFCLPVKNPMPWTSSLERQALNLTSSTYLVEMFKHGLPISGWELHEKLRSINLLGLERSRKMKFWDC